MALNHTHQKYDNFVLQTEFENQYTSLLDLMRFCTVDDSLEGTPGQTVKVNRYSATNGTETLQMGSGNTKNIEVKLTSESYTIEMMQNRFPYYDEEEMIDPNVVTTGLRHMAVDMFNTANGKAMAEFNKATLNAEVEAFDFNAFVDGAALFPENEQENMAIFGLVHPKDKAEIRKNLKDDLKYVESYARTGYIGHVAGVPLYNSNLATQGTVILATKEAVKYFVKKGTETEQERDANVRLNIVYARKYGLFAFVDDTKAVKLTKKVQSSGVGEEDLETSGVDG